MQNSHRQINIFLFLLLFCLNLKAQTDFSFENISKIGLPVISINTLNGEEPTCDYITHPEGSMGESITNATKSTL